jgi:hypothetical protein
VLLGHLSKITGKERKGKKEERKRKGKKDERKKKGK